MRCERPPARKAQRLGLGLALDSEIDRLREPRDACASKAPHHPQSLDQVGRRSERGRQVAQRRQTVGGGRGLDDAGNDDACIQELARHQQKQGAGTGQHDGYRGHCGRALQGDLRRTGVEHAGQRPAGKRRGALHRAGSGDQLRRAQLERPVALQSGDGKVARHVPHQRAMAHLDTRPRQLVGKRLAVHVIGPEQGGHVGVRLGHVLIDLSARAPLLVEQHRLQSKRGGGECGRHPRRTRADDNEIVGHVRFLHPTRAGRQPHLHPGPCLDHARLHVLPAIDLHQAVEAHTHQAQRCARFAGYRCVAKGCDTRAQQRDGERVAFVRFDGAAIDVKFDGGPLGGGDDRLKH